MLPSLPSWTLPLALLSTSSLASFDTQHTLQAPTDPEANSWPYLRYPPSIGFGTWNLNRTNATEAVSHAIQTGYTHIDCAAAYHNEALVGAGIADGLRKARRRRDSVWITSKLWNSAHAPHLVRPALEKTLHDLRLSYLDLYLMHWPVSSPPSSVNTTLSYLQTWDAMVALLATRKVRFIGVANFSPAQLDALLKHSPRHRPAVHQMELHPYLQQGEWVAYHAARGIAVTAYSPLGGTNPTYHSSSSTPEHDGVLKEDLPTPLLENKVLLSIAKARNCTAAQVAIAWGTGRGAGVSVIPKSSHRQRIEENWDAGRCELTAEDKAKIAELGEVAHRYNNPSKGWGVELFDGLEGV